MQRRLCLAGLLALGLTLMTAHAQAEDDADAFVRSAEAAWKAKDYAKAARSFERAWGLEPERIHVLLRLAESYDKQKADGPALRAWMALSAAYDERAAKAEPEAKLKAAQKKALKRLKALGKFEAGAETIGKKHAKKLLAFAEKHAGSSPAVALRALEGAAHITSDHSAFEDLMRRLRAKVDKPPDRVKSPFEQKVKSWRDMLSVKVFRANRGWVYGDRLVIDRRDGGMVVAQGDVTTGEDFVYEAELRVKKAYGSLWVFGLIFAKNAHKGLSAWMGPESVEMQQFEGGETKGIGGERKALHKLDEWHRLAVVVRGGGCEVWLDGEKAYTPKLPDGWATSGELGITWQDGVFEIREIRIGRLR